VLCALILVITLLAFAGLGSVARADQLVMFRQAGCPYCARWDREVGVTYDKTDEAKLLPLRQVDLHAARPADLRTISGVIYTPTFIVLHCGHEIARITGYGGPEQFWELLDEAVQQIKESPRCSK